MRDLAQKMTTWPHEDDLWHWILTFRRPFEVTDLGWPYAYLLWLNWRLWGFPGVLKPKIWFIIHTDLFVGPLYRLRWQSGPLTQFVLGFFSGECVVVPFRDVMRHEHLIKLILQHVILFIIERGTRRWKFRFTAVNNFWHGLVSLWIPDFTKICWRK